MDLKKPSVTSDPRFRAGRTLVRTGKAGEGAIGMFATLVEESRRKTGDTSIEAATCYYEYGNALLRAAVRKSMEKQDDSSVKGHKGTSSDVVASSFRASDAAAAAAQRREAGSKPVMAEVVQDKKLPAEFTGSSGGRDNSGPPKKTKFVEKAGNGPDAETKDNKEEEEDVLLALEMMENSWAIFDKYTNLKEAGSTNNSGGSSPTEFLEWAERQVARSLVGIGDVFSFLGRHADAVDAYTRAIPHREQAVERCKAICSKNNPNTDYLMCCRHLVEANVLVAEELLACPAGRDVVTTESKDVLVKGPERVEFATGYYEKARDELQEAVFLLGKIAGTGKDIGTEKEDICHLATMLMDVGNSLASANEKETNYSEHADKKLKTGQTGM